MTLAQDIRLGIHEVGVALRRPEEFTVRWRDRRTADAPRPMVFAVLLVSAVVGMAAYGLAMGLGSGPGAMLAAAVKAPLAAGAAWMVALPALYIINSALGSKLDFSTTLLAALSTVSFGAMAMLAGVPITWFFTVAVPSVAVKLAVQLVTFAGVGLCMVDVFMRTMKALEPDRGRSYALLWLVLVAVIGTELMVFLDLFGIHA
ncbi:MAG: hypothetical protein ACYC8T_28245 [Myxococcaceae bacterium]